MKQISKQILEAINRGLKLALDDIEDDEPNSSLSQHNDIIDSDDVIKYRMYLMKEAVDLGLPSRTLWCKYNLGVNPNKLSKAKNWYGNYYAWGELETKTEFNWDSYKFGKDYNKLTKYCNKSNQGLNRFKDTLKELQQEDDVAYQNKHIGNYKFHIPTKEQCEELINYTINYWVNNYDPNKTIHNPKDDEGIQGLNGRVFVGKNANQMFIPAAGYPSGSDIFTVGSFCGLWSSSLDLDDPNYAYSLDFDSGHIGMSNDRRCIGYSVCPVINL